jgi:poly(3-hydroxybutyrate) depolymerase
VEGIHTEVINATLENKSIAPMPNLFCRLIAIGLIFFFHTGSVAGDGGAIDVGAGRFIFEYQNGRNNRRLTVWTYLPKEFAANGPVLFVMHGVRRDGKRYRNEWMTHAEREKALLLVPEFSVEGFPGGRNYAAPKPNVDSIHSDDLPPSAFLVIERIFDHVLSTTRLETKEYLLYGHSAGAQFVHRFMLFNPRARVKAAVAANAGWYTMPDFTIAFPYGLQNSGLFESGLRAALGRKLIILLGEKDTDPRHPLLNRSASAMRQGMHRLERGQNFYRAGARAAEELNTPFHWQIATVPEADHDNAKIALAAAPLLFPKNSH